MTNRSTYTSIEFGAASDQYVHQNQDGLVIRVGSDAVLVPRADVLPLVATLVEQYDNLPPVEVDRA